MTDVFETLLHGTPPDPYDPEEPTLHAGKVFVIPQSVLRAAGVVASDGTDPALIGDRFLLCLWDLRDGRSLWLAVQSTGDFEIPHRAKYIRRGDDPNWMNPKKQSRYRDGTVWCLGRKDNPFRFLQKQQRGVGVQELDKMRARLSRDSIHKLLT